MNKSKNDLVVKSLQKMDLNMLDILLDNDKTYQGATKEVFLDKMNGIFLELRKQGDTFLLLHTGFCNSEECSNKGCKGYSFVGNNSKKHIDLIFDELGDDGNAICCCYGFETNDKTVETEDLIHISIKLDERADFKPSIDFLIKSQKCSLAYEELLRYQNIVIDKTIYMHWLDKHSELYNSFMGFPTVLYSGLYKFRKLYGEIYDLYEFLQSDDSAKAGIEEFQALYKDNELQLLSWLIKYEKTGTNLTLFLFEDIDFEYPEKSEYFEVNIFKIDTSDFKNIAKFKFLFDLHYWSMLDKYSTFSDEETTRYINENSEMSKYISSLSYHLDKRGIEL